MKTKNNILNLTTQLKQTMLKTTFVASALVFGVTSTNATTKAYVGVSVAGGGSDDVSTLSAQQGAVAHETAVKNCAKMVADGSSIGTTYLNIWRLPSVEELERLGVKHTSPAYLWTSTRKDKVDGIGDWVTIRLSDDHWNINFYNNINAYRCVK